MLLKKDRGKGRSDGKMRNKMYRVTSGNKRKQEIERSTR
jgi:hypothetical protein